MGTLYLVPTPIGNLEDITLRALRVLRSVSLIAAEDTRTSRVLLAHYDITTPTTSYHEHNKMARLDTMLAALEAGDVALISDAGTPGISDPGYELVNEAWAAGHIVVPLPGASAIIPALVGSGLPSDQFHFGGFLPKKAAARRAMLSDLAAVLHTSIFYESPHRLAETLALIEETLGPERPLCIAREISKAYETFHRGTAADLLAVFQVSPPRGEIVLLIGPAAPGEGDAWTEAAVQQALQERLAAGESTSQAAKAVAKQSGWERRAVYALATRHDDEEDET